MIGTTISHYKILEKVGSGGMGVLYKAQDLKLDRVIALKFLPHRISTNDEEKKRFILEAKAASALQHNNICTIHEIDETEDGQMFICMDYYEGESLKNKIEREPLKIEVALDIAIQVASGLVKAHEKEIIHRDIKPANVMLTKDGVAKIVDFGLAKLSGYTKLTLGTTTLGTVAYMAPEQVTGKPVDHRADIWSLGVMLYEMFAGQRPFAGEYLQALMYSIVNEHPESPATLRADIPLEIQQIILKAIEKRPDNRFENMTELLNELLRVQESLKPGKKESIVKIINDQRSGMLTRPLTLIAIFSILIIAMGIYFILPAKSGAFVERDWILITDFHNYTGEEVLSGTLNEALTIDLQQSRYVNVFPKSRIVETLERMQKEPTVDIDEQLGKEVCLREGIKAMMVGNINRIGNVYSISTQIINPSTGDPIITERIEAASKEKVLSSLDQLSKKIRKNLGESLEAIKERDKPLEQVTTSSLEALRYYTIAVEHGRKAEWDESILFYKKAVEADSSFAIAYSKLGSRYYDMGNISEALKYSGYAMKWIDKVTEREKYYIIGEYHRHRGELKKAIENYKILAGLYPDDFTAHNNMAFMYQFTREYEKAIEELNETERLAPNSWYVYQVKGLTYSGLGEIDKAIKAFQKALKVSPQQYWSNVGMGTSYLMKGELEKADNQFEKLLTQEENWQAIGEEWIAMFYMYQGKFREATAHLEKGILINQRIGNKSGEAWMHTMLAEIYKKSGEQNICLEDLKKAASVWPNSRTKTKLGSEYASLNKFNEAQELLERLDTLRTVEQTQNNLANFYRLKGEIDFYKKDFQSAIHNLESSKSLEDDFETRVLLAKIYNKNEQYEKAKEEYEYIIKHQYATLFDALPTLWPLAHYWLAKIYESKGEKDAAIKHYQKFLQLWKDADKELPELIDARHQLTITKSIS